MALIPEDVLEQLRCSIDLKAEIEMATGRVFKKTGAGWVTNCISPDHEDKNPSFQVFHKDGKDICHCHSCGFGGDGLSNDVKSALYSNEPFPALISRLGKQYGVHVPDTRKPMSDADKKKWAQKKQLTDCLASATDIYGGALKSSPEAMAYFKSRGINDESIAKFKLGYATDGWQFLNDKLKSTYSNDVLKKAGLIKENDKGNKWDFFRERYMLPIRDEKGRTISFGGRIPEGRGKAAKYINGPESPVYDKKTVLYGLHESLISKDRVDSYVVVEGYMDVIAAHQHGHPNHVGPCGTALTQTQINKLFKYADAVTLAFDGDAAGHNAAWKSCNTFIPTLPAGKTLNVVFLPDGEDSASMLLADPAGYDKLLRHPTALTRYYFDRLLAEKSANSVEGLAGLKKEASLLVSQIQDADLKALFESELNDRFNLKSSVVGSAAELSVYRKQLTNKHESLLKGASLDARQVSACIAANPILALAMPQQLHDAFDKKSRQPSLSSDDSAHLLTFVYKAAILACKCDKPVHAVTKTAEKYLLKYLEIKGSDYSASAQAETISRYVTDALKSEQSLKKTVEQSPKDIYESCQPS
tara:strand:+ start:582 stop:2339 length:1758 start_codon:yes stop_codon:yes gene_type:complete